VAGSLVATGASGAAQPDTSSRHNPSVNRTNRTVHRMDVCYPSTITRSPTRTSRAHRVDTMVVAGLFHDRRGLLAAALRRTSDDANIQTTERVSVNSHAP
jgi:hypothetical protein